MSSKQTYPKKGKKKVLLHTQNACDEACVCVCVCIYIVDHTTWTALP